MRLDLDKVRLQSGAHDNPKQGMCVMEAVAYIAREAHSDHPECVSPVIGTFLRSWNDSLGDVDRQKLKALIPVVLDTRSTADDEERRSWMLLDWLVREHTPAWLRLAGLNDHADRLAGLPRFKAGMDAPAIRPTINAVRKDADAAGAAARDAAGAAAGAAAWDAAGAAAGAAAWDAARDAAWDAAWAAAWDAAWAAAWAAASAAARDAAGAAAGAAASAAARDAAGAAARAAAWAAASAAAWDAVGAAARAALRPTVEQLQVSALALVERMAWLKEDE